MSGPVSTPAAPTDCDRLLDVLSDGQPHPHADLYRLGMIVHSRVADLRAKGHRIVCTTERTWNMDRRRWERTYWYRLVSTETERGPGATGNGGDSGLEAAAGRDASASTRADAGVTALVSSRSVSVDTTLESYGIDRAIAEANEEHPGLLVGELSVEENRRRLEELQLAIWGEAA